MQTTYRLRLPYPVLLTAIAALSLPLIEGKSVSRLARLRIRNFLLLVIATTTIGVSVEYFEPVLHEDDAPLTILEIAVLWCAGAILIWGFESLFIPSRFGAFVREQSFSRVIAIKSLLLVLVFLAVYSVGNLLFDETAAEEPLFNPDAIREFGLVLGSVVFLQLLIQSARIIGGRRYLNFLIGRYSRPVKEDTVFMFLDLVGSTALAQRIGDVGVQQMITRFFRDIDEPIAEHQGEVHRYVGDQVVVTWPLSKAGNTMDPIRCYFAIKQRVEDRAADYEAAFGYLPHFRAGLHCGSVVISECGDRRRDISYFGDTVNTAARIEEACKIVGEDILVSRDLLDRLALEPGFTARRVDQCRLRGRENNTDLYTVAPPNG